MADTAFVDYATVVPAAWLNDVNDRVYKDVANVKNYGAAGDGVTDDTDAIQEAIDTGLDVFFPNTSNYYKISSTLTVNSNQRLFGTGYNSQIRQTTTLLNVITATSKSNVTIDSLHLYCVGDFSSLANGSAVFLSGCSYSSVRNCVIRNHRGWGVNLYNTNDSKVQNNTFLDAPTTGITDDTDIAGDIQCVYSSSRNIVSGNNCKSGSGTAIKVQTVANGNHCDDNVIDGNTVYGYKIYGIVAYRNAQILGDTTQQTVYRTSITGNTVDQISGEVLNSITSTYTYGAGIYAQGAEGTVISGNAVGNTHTAAVSFVETLAPAGIGTANLTQVVIQGNKVSVCGMHGIEVNDGNNFGTSTGGAVISGNDIALTDDSGIYVTQRNNVSITGNVVDTTGKSGIEINNTSLKENLVISGNQVRNVTGTAGIELNYIDGATVTGNLVDTVNTHGISAANSNSVNITGNIIRDHATRGIYILSTSTLVEVADNLIDGTGSSSEGIRLDAAARYSDNRINGCTTSWAGNFRAWNTLSVDDTTPSVKDGKYFITNNSNPTTISQFDDGHDGQEIFVLVTDANTTLDFTASNLNGNAGADRAMAANDAIRAVYRASGDEWYVTIIDTTA